MKQIDERPILFVGDIQGCARELALLLEKAGFVPRRHRLIPLGDVLNRGPDSPGVLDLLAQAGAEPILGNHEMAMLKIQRTGRVPDRDKKPISAWWQLNEAGRWEAAMETIAQWPLFRRGSSNSKKDHAPIQWVAVHAGLHPHRPPEETPAETLTEIRYCNPQGDQPEGHPGSSMEPPPGYNPWFRHYAGKETVLFGHWARMGLVMQGKPGKQNEGNPGDLPEASVRGLDTGCVYGRKLTGLWWPDDTLVQVDALEAYSIPKAKRLPQSN